MTDKVLNTWNIHIMSGGRINIEDSRIWGSRIGICSNYNNFLNSRISANGRGCARYKGIGAGMKVDYCAGSGGSHGGDGGYGSSESKDF